MTRTPLNGHMVICLAEGGNGERGRLHWPMVQFKRVKVKIMRVTKRFIKTLIPYSECAARKAHRWRSQRSNILVAGKSNKPEDHAQLLCVCRGGTPSFQFLEIGYAMVWDTGIG